MIWLCLSNKFDINQVRFELFLNGHLKRFQRTTRRRRNPPTQRTKRRSPSPHPTSRYLSSYEEIKDTLTLLDKAINNKETRTISRITKNIRKYRNVIKGHHLNALYECLGFDVPESIKLSTQYNAEFSEKIELNKNLITRIVKTMELEGFVKLFLIQIWWREGNYDDCLKVVEDMLNRFTLANRRTLDNYTAYLYHFYSRIHEKKGSDHSIREHLLEALNRACVRDD